MGKLRGSPRARLWMPSDSRWHASRLRPTAGTTSRTKSALVSAKVVTTRRAKAYTGSVRGTAQCRWRSASSYLTSTALGGSPMMMGIFTMARSAESVFMTPRTVDSWLAA